MRVLVTGAGGFLGRALVTRLGSEALPFRGDVREPDAFHGIEADAVIHLAAQSNVAAAAKDPAATWAVNVDGTRHVAAWAAAAGARMVLASTAHVYGRPRASPVAEDHALTPVSAYGASKLGAEAAVRMAQSHGLEAVVVRPFNVYGPGQAQGFLVPDIMAQLRAGAAEVRLGSAKPVRDYTYVDDAVEFLRLAVQGKQAAGQTLNLGSGAGHSVEEVARACLEAAGSEARLRFDAVQRPGDVPELVADAGRANEVLGWKARTTLKDGIRRTWN